MKFLKNHDKIIILFGLMFIFSIIYMFLDDSHFSGVNKFKETIQEEVIKNRAKKEIRENFNNFGGEYELLVDDIQKEKVIDNVTKETKQEAKEILNKEKVKPNLFEKYINRVYFAIISGCLLGYGDIYPVSNISKILTALQGLLTVSLIIY